MLNSTHPLRVTVWLAILAVASAVALTTPSSTVCKTCSTTATKYKFVTRSTVHFEDYVTYNDTDNPTRHVYTGKSTIKAPNMTTTVTVSTTMSNVDSGAPYFFQQRTYTTHSNATTTTTVCPPTSTPAGYPSPQFCACKKTITTTSTIPNSVGTIGAVFTGTTTVTGPPISYGQTTTSTQYFYVDTYLPTVYYVDYTKTNWRKTATSTLKSPPSPIGAYPTFQLKATGNPAIEEDSSYLRVQLVCSNPRACGDPFYLVTTSSVDYATNWSIINNSLHDVDDNYDCYWIQGTNYGGPGYFSNPPAYGIQCGPGQVQGVPFGSVGYLSIDCFGNLQTHVGNATTWGVSTFGPIALYQQPDPVHGLSDAGDSPYISSPKYGGLRIISV